MASLASVASSPYRGPSPVMRIEQARAGGDNNGSATAANNYAPPQPTSEATPAAPQPRSLGDYATQYEQSLAASRADIDHQIASALADINAKEARSSQAVGLLPGELKGIYATGNAGLNQTAGSLDAAQKASGLTSFMGAGAEMAPLRGAIAADSAARQADVPLLNIGLAQQAASEHSALQQQRLAAYAGLNDQNRQFLMQQAAAAAGYAHDAVSQKTGADLALRNTLAAYGAEHPTTSTYQFGNLVSPQAGKSLAEVDPAHAIRLRTDPSYIAVVQQLQGMGPDAVKALIANPTALSRYMNGNNGISKGGLSVSPQAMSLALFDAFPG